MPNLKIAKFISNYILVRFYLQLCHIFQLCHETFIIEISISLVFRIPLDNKKIKRGIMRLSHGQPSAQSKRYHIIEYKLILYAIPLGLKPEMEKE